jgi:hypothetical protein
MLLCIWLDAQGYSQAPVTVAVLQATVHAVMPHGQAPLALSMFPVTVHPAALALVCWHRCASSQRTVVRHFWNYSACCCTRKDTRRQPVKLAVLQATVHAVQPHGQAPLDYFDKFKS